MKNLVYESEKGYLTSGNLFARVNLSFVWRKRFWHLTFLRRQYLYWFLLGCCCMHSSRYWPTFQMCLRHRGAVNPFETSLGIFYITRHSIPEIIHVMKMSEFCFSVSYWLLLPSGGGELISPNECEIRRHNFELFIFLHILLFIYTKFTERTCLCIA